MKELERRQAQAAELTDPARRSVLEDRYRDVFDHPPLVTLERLTRKIAVRDELDPHFAKISMEFASAICRRPMLDERTRYLVLIGQFAVTKSHQHLEDAIGAAIEARVSVAEALEAVLLSHVYAGDTAAEPALAILYRVVTELSVLSDLHTQRLPIDGRARELEAERGTWPEALTSDPRAVNLMETFGWKGVATGTRYRGTHHLDTLEYLDALDRDWGQRWESFVYEGIYSRQVLDDKTRVLCTMADCIALGAAAAASARDHMEEALAFGNSPREVLEVILMGGIYFGFPGVTAARNVLARILADQGKLDEIGNPPIR